MKNYLVVFAVLVSVFAVSCDKDDVNEGDVLELIDVEDFSPAPDPDRLRANRE